MKEKRVLTVSSEVMPYRPENQVSLMSYESARLLHSKGGQTRVFMPRYGLVNERRHQLHEVIRLSGANLIIDDIDTPLIIKVASIPKERMQVYFIDNEEYFKRKAMFHDEEGNLFEDNDERLIFFTKGVITTVKKLNWAPDIIHLHGWISSLIPMYLKHYYKDDALFRDSKIVVSLYDDAFQGHLSDKLSAKIAFDELPEKDINDLKSTTFIDLQKKAVEYADRVIFASDNLSDEIVEYVKKLGNLAMETPGMENFEETYLEFYRKELHMD